MGLSYLVIMIAIVLVMEGYRKEVNECRSEQGTGRLVAALAGGRNPHGPKRKKVQCGCVGSCGVSWIGICPCNKLRAADATSCELLLTKGSHQRLETSLARCCL